MANQQNQRQPQKPSDQDNERGDRRTQNPSGNPPQGGNDEEE